MKKRSRDGRERGSRIFNEDGVEIRRLLPTLIKEG